MTVTAIDCAMQDRLKLGIDVEGFPKGYRGLARDVLEFLELNERENQDRQRKHRRFELPSFSNRFHLHILRIYVDNAGVFTSNLFQLRFGLLPQSLQARTV